jgi:DNA-binding beta-propeller fold protein YncE
MSNNKDFKVKNGIKPTVYHEAVGTVVSGIDNYNIATASYDGVSFDLTAQIPASSSYGLVFNNDGTKMYILDRSPDTIYQYSLSTAFDISTSSYDSVSFNVSSQDSSPFGMSFNNDGTKLYVVGSTNDSAYQYSLSTAFDLSTASYDSVSFNIASQATTPYDICFNNDGTKMYISDISTDTLYQYSLSTTFDLSTASYDSVSLNTSSEGTNLTSAAFNNDGTRVFISDGVYDSIKQYSLSTSFDLSTASYDSVSFNVASQTTSPQSLVFNNDGTKMYVLSTAKSVYQYSTSQPTDFLDLSTGNVFEVTPTSDIQVSLTNPAASGTSSGATLLLDGAATSSYDIANASYDSVSFSVAGQDTFPTGMAFNNDGTKMYILGNAIDSVHQYTLSTAFDLSTASYDSVSFSVAGQDATPADITFNNDGTKMYMVGLSNDSLYQYSLSTDFDLSTASYDSVSLSVSGQDTSPSSIAFNNDGTKMYLTGSGNDSLYQYSLSTAFDLSTASYDSVSFSVNGQDNDPLDIAFNTDGTKVYIVGSGSDSVHQYSLSTAFDLSTASYDSVSFSVGGQDAIPSGMAFNNDGSKIYMLGGSSDTVYQYSTAAPATITYDSTLQWSGGTAPTSPDIGETDVITFNTTDGGTTYKAALAIDGAK